MFIPCGEKSSSTNFYHFYNQGTKKDFLKIVFVYSLFFFTSHTDN